MDSEVFARLLDRGRSSMGIARCVDCGRYEHVTGDNVLDAREDLRDEGWISLVEWDGDDATALANWSCCRELPESE